MANVPIVSAMARDIAPNLVPALTDTRCPVVPTGETGALRPFRGGLPRILFCGLKLLA